MLFKRIKLYHLRWFFLSSISLQLFSTPESIDDVNIHSPVSPSSPYEHPLSTSSSTQGPSQPSFGRAPARRRKRRTDIGVTNNPTLNDYDYIAFDGDLPAIDCQSGNGCYEITCHLDTVGTRKTSFRDSAAIVVTSRFHIDQFLKLSAEVGIYICLTECYQGNSTLINKFSCNHGNIIYRMILF